MFWQALRAALCETDPVRKCAQVAALAVPLEWIAADAGEVRDETGIPGRPARPVLISPREVPNRGLGTVEGRAALVHAVAHIEFNAINLALDAAWRFRDLPPTFTADWISVAQDEARHFQMLSGRLSQMGYAYGDFEAHNGLWEAAEKTQHDVLLRMALVPRVLEARGLDVTPGMIRRLKDLRDAETVAILKVILEEEVRHVAIGTHWFNYLCAQRGLEPQSTFMDLLCQFKVKVRPPLNTVARSAAGFDAQEMEKLLLLS